MTTMRCPLGHPPGPQPFCPICGRATVAAEDAPATMVETVQTADEVTPVPVDPVFDIDVEYGEPASPPPGPPGPTAVTGPTWSDFQDDPAGRTAAQETQRLIDELQAGRPVVPPTFTPPPGEPPPPLPVPPPASWAPAGSSEPPTQQPAEALGAGVPPDPVAPPSPPAQRYETGGVFPLGEMPDYAPLPPESLREPGLPDEGQLSTTALGAAPAESAMQPPAAVVAPPLPGGSDLPVYGAAPDEVPHPPVDDDEPRRSSRRLLPLLLVLVVLLGAAYFASTKLFGGSDDQSLTTPQARPTARSTRVVPVQTYSAEQVAASLKDPHFKHGYDAGVRRAKAGPVPNPTDTCRAMALRERKGGYPWGAQDQQGCIVGITS